MNIEPRQLYALIFVALIASVSFASFFYLQSVTEVGIRQALLEKQQQSQIANTRALADHVSSDLHRIALRLELLAQEEPFQGGELESDAAAAIAQATFTEVKRLSAANSLGIFDSNGIYVNEGNPSSETMQFLGTDLSHREYAIQTKRSMEPYVSDGFMNLNNQPYLVVTAPIVNRQSGEYLGFVAAGMPSIDFFENYGNVLDISSESVVAMDRNGVYLASATDKYIGKNFFAQETQRLVGENADMNRMYSDAVRLGRESYATFNIGTGERFAAASPVYFRGEQVMTVVHTIPTAAVYSEVDGLLFAQRVETTTLLGAVVAAIGGMVAFMLKWNISLQKVVDARTKELRESNEQLSRLNSELQVSNQRLVEANAEIQDHDRMQKEFINIAAHELRTPVQPLLGIADLLEMHDSKGGNGKMELERAEIEMIVRNAKRLERLSSDILEVSRIESQSLKLYREPVDLNQKIRNVVKDSQPFIADKSKLKIVFEPVMGRKILAEADKSKLFEALSNLIRNAIRFTETGTITIKLEANDSYATISIKDTGAGIDPEIMPKLFTKFTTKSNSGTGLGLFITKSIVEAHGGSIWAENNRDGSGATFAFTLPLSKADQTVQE